MYTIKGNGLVWDAEKNKILIRFSGGVYMTEDDALANKLKKLGYTVTGRKSKVEKDVSPGSEMSFGGAEE